MITIRTREELRDRVDEARSEGTVVLVPTMGFLHEGHLSLIDRAHEISGCVVASVFVNPLQFAPSEDLDRYPRDIDRDRRLLEERGVTICFTPTVEEMYPSGNPRIFVEPGAMGERLCGRHRPGHFRGVLTVVARLFGLVRPDAAIFGQKDYQQGVLIRRMVEDLEMKVRVELGPISREPDGLARSSRNALLSPEERKQAGGLHGALSSAAIRFEAGESDPTVLVRAVEDEVARYDRLRLQYAELVDPETLDPVVRARSDSVIAAAAFAGDTRLIDNIVLGAP